MRLDETAVGHEAQIRVVVGESQGADAFGNAGLPALASPALVGLCEAASMAALENFMDEANGLWGA